jgi:hypothetical protein
MNELSALAKASSFGLHHQFLRFLSHPKTVAAIKAKGMEVE